MSDDSELCVVERCLGHIDRVVIWSGHICDRVDDPKDKWRFTYIVDVIEAGPDGGEIGMWDGADYQQAKAMAREIAADWGNLPIVDRTCGGTMQ